MPCHILQCRRAVLASLLIAILLLSACGRGAQGAVPDTTIPSVAPAPEVTASLPVAPFSLDGTIEQLAQEGWVVAGTSVALDAHTTITGTPALGAKAHIEGELTGNAVLRARTIAVVAPAAASTVAPAPTTLPADTPSPILPPTAMPPGTVVNINGVIENISSINNVTFIAVNQISYMLPRNFVLILGKRLRIGVPIVFVGQVDKAGQIVVINVVQINNQVITINPPRQHGEDDDHEGDEDD